MSEELTPDRDAELDIVTPSTEHMDDEERRDGIRQMVEDLYRLATQDGCIAAAWALEALVVQVAEIERLRRERDLLHAVYAEARAGCCSDCGQSMDEAPMRDDDDVLEPCDACEEMYEAIGKAIEFYHHRGGDGA